MLETEPFAFPDDMIYNIYDISMNMMMSNNQRAFPPNISRTSRGEGGGETGRSPFSCDLKKIHFSSWNHFLQYLLW